MTTREICERYFRLYHEADANRIRFVLGGITERPVSPIRSLQGGPNRVMVWAPSGTSDCDVDCGSVFSSDNERLREAILRAETRLGRPVTVAEAKRETEADEALRLNGKRTYSLALHSATLYDGRKHFFFVGAVGRSKYYCAGDLERGSAFVRFQQEAEITRRGKWVEAAESIEACSLASVATGRAMLLKAEIERSRGVLRALIDAQTLDRRLHANASKLWLETRGIEQRLNAAISRHRATNPELPVIVSAEVPVWSRSEMWEGLRPVYDDGSRDVRTLAACLAQRVRRVPRVGSRRWRGLFFDRTGALLYAAQHWGGRECGIQAMLCESVLGDLRDSSFVLPGLESAEFELRLKAVACCAFVWSERGRQRLRDLALSDPDFGVRKAALWAYGFCGGEGATQLWHELANGDSGGSYRQFFRALPLGGEANWWLA